MPIRSDKSTMAPVRKNRRYGSTLKARYISVLSRSISRTAAAPRLQRGGRNLQFLDAADRLAVDTHRSRRQASSVPCCEYGVSGRTRATTAPLARRSCGRSCGDRRRRDPAPRRPAARIACCAPMSASSWPVSFTRSATGTRIVSDPLAAADLDRDLLADAARVDVDAELPAVLHRLAVEGQDDVAGLEARLRRRATRRHVGEHDARHRMSGRALPPSVG